MNDRLAHPPRPRLSLTVGVTGHRALPPESRGALEGSVGRVLTDLRRAFADVAPRHAAVSDPAPPVLSLASGLAAGADQMVAAAALERGYRLRAMLPFAPTDYAADFGGEPLACYEQQLAAAHSVWAGSGDRTAAGAAYMLAGEATLTVSQILLAIWDGAPARGSGGTAQVVEEALRRGLPVIHLHPGDPSPILMWAGHEDIAAERLRPDTARRVPLDAAALDALLEAVLAPPAVADLQTYLAETEKLRRWRIEWPLLLAATRAQPMRRPSFVAVPFHRAAADDAEGFSAVARAAGAQAEGGPFEAAFAWADGLAAHYAHVFRSGIVFNFAGAALAVLTALAAILLPNWKVPLLVLELALVGGVVLNTSLGTRRQWHRRWLDYRHLAESMRLLRSLRLLGAAHPPRRAARDQRWTDWYAQAVWHAMPAPPTLPDPATVRQVAARIAAHDLDGQIAYHRALAARMHRLDHRLHATGSVLLVSTVLIGILTLLGYAAAPDAIAATGRIPGVLSAALPTVGAALFGLRGAGDFAGAASRSAAAAERLARAAEALRREGLSQTGAARALEDAACLMLDDLSEWRSAYATRKLAIPS